MWNLKVCRLGGEGKTSVWQQNLNSRCSEYEGLYILSNSGCLKVDSERIKVI